MGNLFKLRTLLVILGFVLLAVLIWLLGELGLNFGVGGAQWMPLEPISVRLALIGAIVLGWVAFVAWKKSRAAKAGDQLASAVAKQSQGEGRPSAEVVQLRERFEDAIAALKQGKRGGRSLYELPWYVIIGAPGAGKTTALVNSGLHFPLEQRTGKGALRGVGGTRNCDWWFTEEAVLLDTAGRYTTQDSDAAADSAGWAEFLGLLKKYRKRRPLNGVILAISAHDLLVQGQAGREAHVAAARRRLNELNKELHINLPVYVLVTKCDLLAGFTEYFDDLSQEGRSQVWGTTFSAEQTEKGEAATTFPAEFDALVQRLNERVFARLEDVRDVRRRSRVFGFPQQLATLREGLVEFVGDVFESTRFDRRVLLRGVYFTSGTQDGTPIDRLLGALSRRFAVPAEAVAPGIKGRAYFIERLLKDVILAESGFAGVNRRIEFQKAAAQLGSYVGMALLAVLGVLTLSCSYRNNARYLGDVSRAVSEFQTAQPPSAPGSPDNALARLDGMYQVVQVAEQHRASVPWSMSWCLYQGGVVGQHARTKYDDLLKTTLFPRTVSRIHQRLTDYLDDSAWLYIYLKAYVMLGDSAHFNRDYFNLVAKREWSLGGSRDPHVGEQLSEHFQRLLEGGAQLSLNKTGQLDQAAIDTARARFSDTSVPAIMYSLIRLGHKEDPPVVILDEQDSRVLQGRAGAALAVPGLFSRATFEKVVSEEIPQRKKEFEGDRGWVLNKPMPVGVSNQWAQDVVVLYEDEYIKAWEQLLNSVGLGPVKSPQDTTNALRVLGGPKSPLKTVWRAVDAQTSIKIDKSKLTGWIEALGKLVGAKASEPGERVAARFKDIHEFVSATGEGSKAPVDTLVASIQQLQQGLAQADPDRVGGSVDPNNLNNVARMAGDLKLSAGTMPPGVAGIVSEIGDRAGQSVGAATRSTVEQRYRTEVVDPCNAVVNRGYPFTNSAEEVPIVDFAKVFGPGGRFDKFFNELRSFVDTSRVPWTWAKSLNGTATPLLSDAELAQFQRALDIRKQFFLEGAEPTFAFDLYFASLDATIANRANKVVVGIDGKPFEYAYGPTEIPRRVTWPGPGTGGVSEIRFEDKQAGPRGETYPGRWSLFRLFEAGNPKEEAADRFLLSFQKYGHSAELRFVATSLDNPFHGLTQLKKFRCGG